jgi:hypothetical protein
VLRRGASVLRRGASVLRRGASVLRRGGSDLWLPSDGGRGGGVMVRGVDRGKVGSPSPSTPLRFRQFCQPKAFYHRPRINSPVSGWLLLAAAHVAVATEAKSGTFREAFR